MRDRVGPGVADITYRYTHADGINRGIACQGACDNGDIKRSSISGPDILKKVAGTDATNGFKKAGHSPKAMGLRDGLYIGELKRNLKSELAKVLRPGQELEDAAMLRMCLDEHILADTMLKDDLTGAKDQLTEKLF